MTTTAKVKVTLEFRSASHWSDDVVVSQVRKQAVEGIVAQLRHALTTTDFSVIGEPIVTVISSVLPASEPPHD